MVSIGPPSANAAIDPFKQGMHDLGWVEGRTVEYRITYDQGDTRRRDLVDQLIAQQVEVIVTGSAVGTRAAQRATKSIPIVMTFIVDAVGNGLVDSLARPGGNTTGLSNQLEDLFGKLIEQLHAAVPRLRRIAILLNEDNPSHAAYWMRPNAAVRPWAWWLLRVTAGAPANFNTAIEQMIAQRAEAVVVHADPVFSAQRGKLADTSCSARSFPWPTA